MAAVAWNDGHQCRPGCTADPASRGADGLKSSAATKPSRLRTISATRVATELAERLRSEHEGDHRLGDDPHRRAPR